MANVLPVEFGMGEFAVWARDIAEDEDLGSLRRSHASKWSVQWERGKVFFLPLGEDLRDPPGTTRINLEVSGHLRLLARLTTESLVRRFPDYEPLRRKPFTFLGRRQQLLRDAGEALGIDNAFLADFRIWPKYSLDARVWGARSLRSL